MTRGEVADRIYQSLQSETQKADEELRAATARYQSACLEHDRAAASPLLRGRQEPERTQTKLSSWFRIVPGSLRPLQDALTPDRQSRPSSEPSPLAPARGRAGPMPLYGKSEAEQALVNAGAAQRAAKRELERTKKAATEKQTELGQYRARLSRFREGAAAVVASTGAIGVTPPCGAPTSDLSPESAESDPARRALSFSAVSANSPPPGELAASIFPTTPAQQAEVSSMVKVEPSLEADRAGPICALPAGQAVEVDSLCAVGNPPQAAFAAQAAVWPAAQAAIWPPALGHDTPPQAAREGALCPLPASQAVSPLPAGLDPALPITAPPAKRRRREQERQLAPRQMMMPPDEANTDTQSKKARKHRQDVVLGRSTPDSRREAVQAVKDLAETRGRDCWEDVSRATGHSVQQLKRFAHPARLKKDEQWKEKFGAKTQPAFEPDGDTARLAFLKPGVKPSWKRFLSTDTGRRVGPDGGKKQNRPDLFLSRQLKIGQWARREMGQGKGVSADDLFDEYRVRLEQELYEFQHRIEPLSEKEQAFLPKLQQRVEAFKKRQSRDAYRKRLVFVTGFQEREPWNTTPLTAEENDLICELSWDSFDWLIDQLSTSSAEELKNIVYDPAAWVERLRRTALFARDAVPVYLDPSTGKLLQSVDQLAGQGANLEAEGASRKEKNRMTWICRQGVFGWWDLPDGNTLPRGEILDSILIVPCEQPCRLADMSEGAEPAVWTRTHTVVINDRIEERKEGEKVGGLLRSWRELRRQNPHLFQRGVKIYGQKECTMDEQICGLLTEEDREDAAKHGASQSVC